MNSISNKQVGKVVWFDDLKGFGFVENDQGIQYFVHYTNIKTDMERKTLKQGQSITFVPDKNDKGAFAKEIETT